MLTRENAAAISQEALASFPSYPSHATHFDRGIVICGGGIKYGTCAYVLVRLLRALGCALPIEVWSLNDDEYDPQWAELVEPFGVTCINALDIQKYHPHPRLKGWQLKPYAILHSGFREVLSLDADNNPVIDPTFLFDRWEYQEAGAIFWPDPANFRTPRESDRWKVFDVEWTDGPDQESGQLLVDRERCWKALSLCNWYNENSDFYYKVVYGDKDTFRFAWQHLRQPIAWIPHFPSNKVPLTLTHHDFDGNTLFQHRIHSKWQLFSRNSRLPGFVHEDLCLSFVEDLRRSWEPQHHLLRNLTAHDRQRMAELSGQRFVYDRPGNNRWAMEFDSDGRVRKGYGPNEYFWLHEDNRLVLIGTDGKRKTVLAEGDTGAWETESTSLRDIHSRLKPFEPMTIL